MTDRAGADPWDALRRFTPARIALGRAGAAQRTRELLDFAMAHAKARDAVHIALDVAAVGGAIAGAGFEVLRVESAAPDRATYLARPDLGRTLSAAAEAALSAWTANAVPPRSLNQNRNPHPPHAEVAAEGGPRSTHDRGASFEASLREAPQDEERGRFQPASRDEEGGRQPKPSFDLAIVVADGLSSPAVERNAVPLLGALRPWITSAGWRLAPIVLATQARVALGDAVAARLGAAAVLVLIGERPGLSAPDSLGAYLTFGPRPGTTTDADRNCLSNIRPEGLAYDRAAFQIAWLADQALRRRVTGIRLKDESDRLVVDGRLPEPARLSG